MNALPAAWGLMSMLSSDEVVQDIIERLSTMPELRAHATADSRIAEDLKMDSLAIMNFIMTLEDHYDMALPLDRLAKIKTVRELANLIVQLRNTRTTT